MNERPATPATPPLPLAAALAILGVAVIASAAAAAAAPANPCGNTVAVLNGGQAFETFDRDNGGGGRRLRFRLDGREAGPQAGPDTRRGASAAGNAGAAPDAASNTGTDDKTADTPARDPEASDAGTPDTRPATPTASRIEIVAKAAAGDTVIATVDIKGRSASYCLMGASRVDTRPDQRRAGCPASYLRNFLQIRLVDGDGPFARRDVDIDYLYRPDPTAVSLQRCAPARVLDGAFRRHEWTVTLEDGAAVHIGETDFPRPGRAPVPQDAPLATTVTGAGAP